MFTYVIRFLNLYNYQFKSYGFIRSDSNLINIKKIDILCIFMKFYVKISKKNKIKKF